jgi:hypothetical protein
MKTTRPFAAARRQDLVGPAVKFSGDVKIDIKDGRARIE